jgi:hypothetical protein
MSSLNLILDIKSCRLQIGKDFEETYASRNILYLQLESPSMEMLVDERGDNSIDKWTATISHGIAEFGSMAGGQLHYENNRKELCFRIQVPTEDFNRMADAILRGNVAESASFDLDGLSMIGEQEDEDGFERPIYEIPLSNIATVHLSGFDIAIKIR